MNLIYYRICLKATLHPIIIYQTVCTHCRGPNTSGQQSDRAGAYSRVTDRVLYIERKGNPLEEVRYHIDELATAAGISRRTIHFYVSKGLLPYAEGSGRNGYYTQVHLDRLMRIRKLREKLVALDEIKQILDQEAEKAPHIREEGPRYDAQPAAGAMNMVLVQAEGGVQILIPENIWEANRDNMDRLVQAVESILIQTQAERAEESAVLAD